MRAIGALLLALATAACAPDEAGLIVRAIPAEGVRMANRLEVYVGYEEASQDRRQLPMFVRHIDDDRDHGQDIPDFEAPIDFWLEGEETRPMWIAVRALRDGFIVGEGGFPHAVTQPTDHVERADIEVTPGTIEGNRGCVGFRDDAGVPHYIVPDPNIADCDRDNVLEGPDCDDFDREVQPGAVDTVCDGIDLDCAPGSPTIAGPCAALNQFGECVLGTAVCNDETGIRQDCLFDIDTPSKLPPEVCSSCLGQSGIELIDCARPFANEVSCEVEFVPSTGFCQDTGAQLDPLTWYEDQGAVAPSAGYAQWTPLPPGVEYGWVEGNYFSPAISTAWPPSPAVRVSGLPIGLHDRRDLLLVMSQDPTGVNGLAIVEMRFDRDDNCDLDGPDCSAPFPP